MGLVRFVKSLEYKLGYSRGYRAKLSVMLELSYNPGVMRSNNSILKLVFSNLMFRTLVHNPNIC